MPKSLSKVVIINHIRQRGTGQIIRREEAIVYDFMPVILGDKFRTDSTLSKMLLRPEPEDAPFMLETDAYETLGLRYVREGLLVPALECYRIALDSRTSFVGAVAEIQENVLLNPNEIRHMDVSSDLEKKLVEEIAKSDGNHDQFAYASWVEELRTARKAWSELNRNNYGSREYVEACLKIGEYKEALSNAKDLRDKKLIRRVKQAIPNEILDIKFLRKFIDDNFPESTIVGR